MLELVMPEDQAEVAKVMMPLAIDQSRKTLSSRLDPEQPKASQAAMASVGLPAAQFDMFEPWFPAITLSLLPLTTHGHDPDKVAENILTRVPKTAGNPVAGLQTPPKPHSLS